MLSNQRSIFKRFRYTQVGLQLWISADAIATITANASNQVSQWKDRTTNVRHFTQGTDANKPTFVSAAINSLPAIRFNGSNNFLNFSDPTLSWLNSSSFTIAYVAAKTGSTNAWVIGGQGGGTRNNLFNGYATSNTYRIGFGNDDQNAITPVVTAGRPELYVLTYSNTDNTRVIRRNGSLVGLSASNGSLTGMSGQTLGRYLTSYGQFDLGEMLIYNRVLSAYEINQIERDLLSKWSIS